MPPRAGNTNTMPPVTSRTRSKSPRFPTRGKQACAIVPSSSSSSGALSGKSASAAVARPRGRGRPRSSSLAAAVDEKPAASKRKAPSRRTSSSSLSSAKQKRKKGIEFDDSMSPADSEPPAEGDAAPPVSALGRRRRPTRAAEAPPKLPNLELDRDGNDVRGGSRPIFAAAARKPGPRSRSRLSLLVTPSPSALSQGSAAIAAKAAARTGREGDGADDDRSGAKDVAEALRDADDDDDDEDDDDEVEDEDDDDEVEDEKIAFKAERKKKNEGTDVNACGNLARPAAVIVAEAEAEAETEVSAGPKRRDDNSRQSFGQTAAATVTATTLRSPKDNDDDDSSTALKFPLGSGDDSPEEGGDDEDEDEEDNVSPRAVANDSDAVVCARVPKEGEESLPPLPPGAIDIDLLPERCCASSASPGPGYDWIRSAKRCPCALDSDHCSAATTTEIYLAGYGRERYGVHFRTGEAYEFGSERRLMAMLAENEREKRRRRGLKGYKGMAAQTKKIAAPAPSASSVARFLDYLPRQPNLTADMRAILMDWLVELAEEYKLTNETLHLSATLVDRSLACGSWRALGGGGSNGDDDDDDDNDDEGKSASPLIVQREVLQCLGCACTLIASKIEEIQPPTADDFVYISDSSYTQGQILDMERWVCDALKFHLAFVTPYHYVHRFLRASHASAEGSTATTTPSKTAARTTTTSPSSSPFSPRRDIDSPPSAVGYFGTHHAANGLVEHLVLYLLDLSTLDYSLASAKPSLVAAGVIYLARATLGIREHQDHHHAASVASGCNGNGSTSTPGFLRSTRSHWSKTLEHYTGYDLYDLEPTVRALHKVYANSECGGLKSVFAKHKQVKYGSVALRTVPNAEDLGFY